MRGDEGAVGLRAVVSPRAKGAPGKPARPPADVIALRAAAEASPSGPQLDPRCEAYIGEWLKAHYAQILDQPLPDRFAEILSAIDTGGEKR